MIKTYNNLLTALLVTNPNVFVSVHYVTGTYEWLMVDSVYYINLLKSMGNPEIDFPCYVEFDATDNALFIHTLVPNKHSI